jgi:hypothetical protein
MSEIQVLFSARISRVKVAGGFVAATVAVDLGAGGFASGSAAGSLVALVADGMGDVAEDVGSVCGDEVPAGIVGDNFSGDRVPTGDAAAGIGELAEEGWFAAEAGAEAGAGDWVENGARCDVGAGWAWRRKFQKARTNVTNAKVMASLPHGTGRDDSSALGAGSPAGYF